jgi:cytoskeleton protein RodZ
MTPKDEEKQAARETAAESSKTQRQALGETLRRAREDLGLDFLQLAEITRLRPPILESLENEEWDRLPAPVFVKGFLRAYARALRLPEQDILRLYSGLRPDVSPAPRPLASLTPRRKKTPVAVFIFLIFLIGLAFFAWHRYDLFHGTKESLMTGEGPIGKVAAPARENQSHAPPLVKKRDDRAKTGVVPEAPGAGPEGQPPGGDLAKTDTGPEKEGTTALPDKTKPPDQAQSAVVPLSKRGEPSGMKDTVKSTSQAFTLQAEVRETTWLRIFVDHDAPKEYVFRPGSHPEWKAHEGFQIIIGNAGGIALVFNGRKLDNLGRHGKVIRLKLPEKVERTPTD